MHCHSANKKNAWMAVIMHATLNVMSNSDFKKKKSSFFSFTNSADIKYFRLLSRHGFIYLLLNNLDLMNPILPDDPSSKTNLCMKNIFRIWEENAEKKSTQLCFCDFSTPKLGAGTNIRVTRFHTTTILKKIGA